MLGHNPAYNSTQKLNSAFNGLSGSSHHRAENNFSTIKIAEKTDRTFTTQSSQLVVDEPSRILTTSIFPTTTTREQYPDGRPFNSFQTTDGKAAEFPTLITATTKDRGDEDEEALSFLSASTSSAAPLTTSQDQQQEQEQSYVQNTRHLSSSITSSQTRQLQKQLVPNITMENEDDILSTINNYHYNSSSDAENTNSYTNSTTIDIFESNNTTTTTTEYFPNFPNDTIEPIISQEFQIYASFLCFIACIGIVGNSSIIHLIFREFQLNIKTHFTNMFIVSLAIADIILCILVAFPASVSMSIGQDPTSGFICGIQCMANYLATTASIGTLTIISIDRFISVRWPLHYHKWVTANRLRTALVTVWIQALIASTHAVSHTKTVEYEDTWKILCVTNWSTSTDSLAFGIFSLVWFIITPVLLAICANTLLLRHIFMGKEEGVDPVMTLRRQNAFRGVPVMSTANGNHQNEIQEHNDSRFTVQPVYLQPPKPVNAWANMTNVRFHMQTPVVPINDDEEREVQLFTRPDPLHTMVNDNCDITSSPMNISYITGNDCVANTEVTSDQVLKCYLVVTVLYILLHFPTFVLFIIKYACDLANKTPGSISYFSFIFHLISATLNPFLYAALRKDFRKSYHQMFKRLPAIDFNR